jgi:hypothetical protein
MHADTMNALELRLLHRFQQHVTEVKALDQRLTRLESLAGRMEAHAYVASIALLHTALMDSSFAETVMAAEALRLAYRMEGGVE